MGENVLKFGTYVRVGNAAEAYELLQKNRNNKIVGGGIWMRLGSRRVATAIDLSACGLDQIEETETEFRIGAMCTLRQLERHAELNALVNHVFEFAVHDIVGVQLRNTATVGGSIYGRFGFSDVLSAFLALDSYVELTGAGRVPLAEFVDMGYVRDVIEHVVVVKHDYRASYEAVRKAATDFPSLNVTAAWWDNSWHVTVGERPLRATLLQGEECGLVGTLGVLAAFGVIAWQGMKIARCASDLSGRLVAVGCTSLLAFQMLLNVCGVIGIFPLSGKPIPFLSYGGSSIMASLLIVGALVSVSVHSSLPETVHDRTRRTWQQVADESDPGSLTFVSDARPRSARGAVRQQAQGRGAGSAHPQTPSPFRVVAGGAQGRSGGQARPQRGRVTTDANGRRRIDLGPSASDRLRGGSDGPRTRR